MSRLTVNETVHDEATSLQERTGQLCMLGAMIIAGTIGYFVMLSGQNPFNVVFFRCVIGGAALIIYCWIKGFFKNLHFSAWQSINLVIGGVILVFNWYFVFKSYRLTSIGITTVIYNFQPFLLLLAGFLFYRQRPTLQSILCLIVGFIGLVMVANPSAGRPSTTYLEGVANALIAAALYALTTLMTMRSTTTHRPELVAAFHMVIGAAVFVFLADFQNIPKLPHEIFSITILGLFHTTFMFVLLYTAFKKAKTSSVAVLGFVFPLVAVIVDYIAYNKIMSFFQIIGSTLIMASALAHSSGSTCGIVRIRNKFKKPMA